MKQSSNGISFRSEKTTHPLQLPLQQKYKFIFKSILISLFIIHSVNLTNNIFIFMLATETDDDDEDGITFKPAVYSRNVLATSVRKQTQTSTTPSSSTLRALPVQNHGDTKYLSFSSFTLVMRVIRAYRTIE